MRRLALVAATACLMSLAVRARTTTTLPTGPAAEQSIAGDVVSMKKGTIAATIEVDGWFEPIDPLEVRIRPRQFQGELRIKSIVAAGASVKPGDVILEIDATEPGKQLAEAENALVAAKANLAKAESDDYLGEQSDALALTMQQDKLASAEGALKWWEEVDGKQMLTQAELSVRQTRNNVEDQSDELDQLRKMYKTEELTNATADIVVKRAVRSLDLARIQQGLSEAREGKIKAYDYTIARQRLVFNIDSEKQQLAQLRAQQENTRIIRKTAIVAARLALDKARTKVDELKADLESLVVHAPDDGIVFYGQLVQGTWQNNNPKALRGGEKVTAGQVVATFLQPGKLRVVVDIPEAKIDWIETGAKARVVPIALPQAAGVGECARIAPCPAPHDGAQAFQAEIELPAVEPKVLPGMKADVRIDTGEAKDVLVLPASAVSKGRVKVRADGKDEWRDVIIGKSDGELVEIRQGLDEADQVLTKAGK